MVARASGLALLWALVACTGAIEPTAGTLVPGPNAARDGTKQPAGKGPAGDTPGDETPGNESPTDPTPDDEGPSACTPDGPIADPGPSRRLSDAQYANTVRDLGAHFGVDLGAIRTPFPGRGNTGTFSTAYGSNTVSAETALALQERSEAISAAMTGDLAKLLGCAPTDAPGDACAFDFIGRFAFRAFRRPPLSEEVASLTALYDTLVAMLGPPDATRAVIEAALQSPLFLYIDGGAELVASGQAPFDPYALANRISYFLWDSMPDQALFDAAQNGSLLDADTLRAEVQRMLDDPRAAATIRSFHHEWLRLASPTGLTPDPAAYPEWTPELAASVAEETDRFIDQTVWQDSGTFADLMTSRQTSVDGQLGALYALSDPPADWTAAELPEDRRGLLTRAHFLATHRPILRGVVLIDRLLCNPLMAPANVNATLPEPSADEPPRTARERFEQHSSNPQCAACHRIIDPIGFSFEHYGADGAFRDEYENGLPITTAGELEAPIAAVFADSGELIDRLVSEPRVHACYGERLAEWAIGRGLSADERCGVERLSSAAAPLPIRDLIAEIATSELMRMRGAAEGP
jgi:hypothetical protein